MRNKSTLSLTSDGVRSTTALTTQDDPNNALYAGDLEEDSDRCDPIQQALLAEQEENRRLREESQQVREQNSVLINRLKNLGGSTALSPEDSELLVPEISRELLDNLVRENLRIKRELQNKSSSTHLTSQMEELEQLRREKVILNDHLRQAQSLRTASADEKDAAISRLTAELEGAKAEISELAAQCRQLVQQQDENKKTSYLSDNIKKLSIQNGNDEHQQLKRQNDELRGEIQQVRLQFQEVVQSNTQWQTYDQQREEHMKRLNKEKQELELKLARGGGNVSPQHNQDFYKRLQESENERQHLADCNRALEMRVQQLERAIGSTQEERERVHALENQVQVFSEDFRQERKDRETAQARATRLEEDNQLLRQQLEQFQSSHMAFLAQRRSDTMQRYHDEYQRQRGLQTGYGSRNTLVSHGPYGQVVADGSDDEDEDILDVPMSQAVRGNTDNNSSNGSLPPQQSNLECPKCHQQFPVDDPMQFLEHNDQCNS